MMMKMPIWQIPEYHEEIDYHQNHQKRDRDQDHDQIEIHHQHQVITQILPPTETEKGRN